MTRGLPIASKAWSTPPRCSWHQAATSVSAPSRVWVAPKRRATARRSGERSTATTGSAPTRRRPMTTLRPTPPVPTTTADSPGRTPAVFMTAPTPVVIEQPSSAPMPNGSSAGTLTAAVSGTTSRSVKAPSPR